MSYVQQAQSHTQIYPTFMPGYPTALKHQTYHNIGQLASPYLGKKGVGDYSWPQNTTYYTDYNRNYPYPLDPPCNGCCLQVCPKECCRHYPRDWVDCPFYKFNRLRY